MGSSLGRLAVALARGRAGQARNRYAREQDEFEQERELAREEDARAYREGMLENQRQQIETARVKSIAEQRMALEMRNRRKAALLAAGMDPVKAEALADDEAGARSILNPTPRPIDDLSAEGIQARKEIARYEASLRPQGGSGGEAGWTIRDTPDGVMRFNARTGQVEPFRGPGGTPVRGAQGQGSVSAVERQNASLYQFAEPAAKRVLTRYGQGKTPNTMDRLGEAMKVGIVPDMFGNMLQSDDAQQMYDDLTNIVLATQYVLSGKAVTEAEARKLARGLMPTIGDKPGRAAQKVEEINNRMRVLRMAAGRGIDPNATQMEPTSVDEINQQRRPPLGDLVR